jgi:hypothetical protein
MSLSISQQRALALIPKISAGLSVVCSSIIAAMVLKSKSSQQKTYHRLVLGISFADICSSSSYFMSTWPIPRETGILWAIGNTQTCAAQGFFLQAAVASPLYNVSLSIYFLLAVKQGRGESKQVRRIEPLFHILPLLWGYGTAIAGLCLKIFNSANLWCWIADHPGTNENTSVYRWALFYGPLWLGVLTVTFNLVKLFLYVRRLAKQSEKNARSSSCDFPAIDEQPGENNREYDDYDYDIDAQAPGYDQEGGNDELEMPSQLKSSPRIEQQEYRPEDAATARKEEGSSSFDSVGTGRSAVATGSAQEGGKTAQAIADRRNKLAWQCLRYAVAFYATWTPITILRILQAFHKPIPFMLLLFASCCTPLQGLPNFLAYLYPRLVKGAKRFRLLRCLEIHNVRNKNTPSEIRSRHCPQGDLSPSEAFHEAYAQARHSFRNLPPSSGHTSFFPRVAPRIMVGPDGLLANPQSGSTPNSGAVLDRALPSISET